MNQLGITFANLPLSLFFHAELPHELRSQSALASSLMHLQYFSRFVKVHRGLLGAGLFAL